jgi:ribulose-phosphate 3-epimerase
VSTTKSNYVIAPSILSADFAQLGGEITTVSAALSAVGAGWIHFDVMDNHYVPNLTMGPMVCQAIRPYTQLPIDVHLMVEPVDALATQFAKAGANIITFHPEASRHVHRTLALIRDLGCQVGIVLNPATPIDLIDEVIHELDVVLLMSVNPGFGGQSFIPSTLTKIQRVKQKLVTHAAQTGKQIRLEVDGGIKIDNIARVAAAGADTFVAGSAIFGQPDYAQVIRAMYEALA